MTTHLSTRLVWHDRGWDGHIRDHPSKNASCIAVRHIREAPRDDDRENDSAGQLLSTLTGWQPPCARDPGAFSAHDYSQPGGDIAVAVFDDRIEIASYGSLPPGITVEMLSGPHQSVLRNPLIAQTFHRTGAVENWGRGTNRVIDECSRYGIEPPSFEQRGNSVVVTFRANIAASPQVTPQVLAILVEACEPRSRTELQRAAGLRDRKNFRVKHLDPLVSAGWLKMTIPEKPNSSQQRYRITDAGQAVLSKEGTE